MDGEIIYLGHASVISARESCFKDLMLFRRVMLRQGTGSFPRFVRCFAGLNRICRPKFLDGKIGIKIIVNDRKKPTPASANISNMNGIVPSELRHTSIDWLRNFVPG